LIGEIPAAPGAEPLRGIHLQAALASDLSGQFLDALVRAGRIQMERANGRVFATGPLPTAPVAL
jgi:hypothetical protein